MLTVAEVEPEIKKVLGTCSDEVFYSALNEAIEELANLGNWDPMVMFMDICTQGCDITLPDDVEVPLAINVGGHPADFRNKWFEFHQNGPGSQCCKSTCSYTWNDKGQFPVFRDPSQPSLVRAYPEGEEVSGANIRVYGYDDCEKWIMTPDCDGVLKDGFDVPIFSGMGAGMTTNIKVKRITRVSKPITNSFIRLVAMDGGSCGGGTLLGVFRPNFKEPSFRRISVSGAGCGVLCGTNSSACCTTWVRMRFRRKTFKVSDPTDAIPLNSVTALKMMAMAIRKYENDLLKEYDVYKEAAKQCLMLEQKSSSGPNQIKLQFQGGSYAGSPCSNMV